MSTALPLEIVFVEFLWNLSRTVQDNEPVVLVLRGSLLLRHWFGERARPAADIDFECFERRRGGRGARFPTLVDHGRGLCNYATFDWPSQEIEFIETDVPDDGQALWEYGTPGERFYIGWAWPNRGGQSGLLQIDIAESGSQYDLKDIGVADVAFTAIDGQTFHFPAYTPEMLLAAKLSWLLRGFTHTTNNDPKQPIWKGEPKDLFDVHLLVTQANLRAEPFQKSLLAVGAEDKLEWKTLQAIFDVQHRQVTDDEFPNWKAFQQRHPGLVDGGPVQLLQTIANRLEPLLGDLYLRQEMPFLLTINADPVDEPSYLVYADWLEERGNPRSQFLRLLTSCLFHGDDLPPQDFARVRSKLQTALRATSVTWLHQLFGSAARYRATQQQIEDGAAQR